MCLGLPDLHHHVMMHFLLENKGQKLAGVVEKPLEKRACKGYNVKDITFTKIYLAYLL